MLVGCEWIVRDWALGTLGEDILGRSETGKCPTRCEAQELPGQTVSL